MINADKKLDSIMENYRTKTSILMKERMRMIEELEKKETIMGIRQELKKMTKKIIH